MTHGHSRINEAVMAAVLLVISVLIILALNMFLPPMLEGLSYGAAVADNMGLRLLGMAIFDVHAAVLLFFAAGHKFKVFEELLKTPFGRLAFGIILAAWIVGSGLAFLK